MQGTSTKALRVILILFSIWMALPACCPTGIYEDTDSGAVYQLFTDFGSPEDDAFAVLGTVDTGEIGCGVWALAGTSWKLGEERRVEWDVKNPNRNPTDACCYEFHFVGQVLAVECTEISGQYTTNDGKCTQSGHMSLTM